LALLQPSIKSRAIPAAQYQMSCNTCPIKHLNSLVHPHALQCAQEASSSLGPAPSFTLMPRHPSSQGLSHSSVARGSSDGRNMHAVSATDSFPGLVPHTSPQLAMHDAAEAFQGECFVDAQDDMSDIGEVRHPCFSPPDVVPSAFTLVFLRPAAATHDRNQEPCCRGFLLRSVLLVLQTCPRFYSRLRCAML
jgi:hypothetical protein